jgi:AMMECR1 domain-containing protein
MDRESFLAHTCAKAGLAVDCWRKGAKVYRFAAEVFGR